MTPGEQAKMLRSALDRHRHLYYTLAEPIISDYEYDMLERELIDLEAAHPELVTADSPTQNVGPNLSKKWWTCKRCGWANEVVPGATQCASWMCPSRRKGEAT